MKILLNLFRSSCALSLSLVVSFTIPVLSFHSSSRKNILKNLTFLCENYSNEDSSFSINKMKKWLGRKFLLSIYFIAELKRIVLCWFNFTLNIGSSDIEISSSFSFDRYGLNDGAFSGWFDSPVPWRCYGRPAKREKLDQHHLSNYSKSM